MYGGGAARDLRAAGGSSMALSSDFLNSVLLARAILSHVKYLLIRQFPIATESAGEAVAERNSLWLKERSGFCGE